MSYTRKQDYLNIPIHIDYSEGIYFASIDDSKNILGLNLGGIVQGDTEAEAKEKLVDLLKIYINWMQEDHQSLRKWKPFRKGPKGSKWFTIFGIGFTFRLAKKNTKKFMKGGIFIPFTNLNVNLINEWKRLKV